MDFTEISCGYYTTCVLLYSSWKSFSGKSQATSICRIYIIIIVINKIKHLDIDPRFIKSNFARTELSYSVHYLSYSEHYPILPQKGLTVAKYIFKIKSCHISNLAVSSKPIDIEIFFYNILKKHIILVTDIYPCTLPIVAIYSIYLSFYPIYII